MNKQVYDFLKQNNAPDNIKMSYLSNMINFDNMEDKTFDELDMISEYLGSFKKIKGCSTCRNVR